MRGIVIACLLLVACGESEEGEFLSAEEVRQRYVEAVCTHVSDCDAEITFDSCARDLDIRLDSDMERGWPQPTTESQVETCESFIESIECETRPRPSIWWSFECDFGQA